MCIHEEERRKEERENGGGCACICINLYKWKTGGQAGLPSIHPSKNHHHCHAHALPVSVLF